MRILSSLFLLLPFLSSSFSPSLHRFPPFSISFFDIHKQRLFRHTSDPLIGISLSSLHPHISTCLRNFRTTPTYLRHALSESREVEVIEYKKKRRRRKRRRKRFLCSLPPPLPLLAPPPPSLPSFSTSSLWFSISLSLPSLYLFHDKRIN